MEELDSLYYRFIQVRAPELIPEPILEIILSDEDKKCGLELVNSIKMNLENFPSSQRNVLNKVLQRTPLHTSIVSESGRFRIHFDTTGYNTPSYIPQFTALENAFEVSKAIDSAYNFEVNFLDYLPPPDDFGEGGDNLYDIYIFRTGFYGSTTPENIINAEQQTYTSYIEIDPKFGDEFFTHGIDAMRVTVAHELHHAIQIGNYTLRYNEDGFFYEITSTAMEEFVFDDVNDYFQYLGSYFAHPDKPMPQQNGYNMAIWNIYLKERFGFGILKTQWELMPNFRAITTINNSIINEDSALPRELNKFGIWTYFTNYRAIPGLYFEDAAEYPLITPTQTIDYFPNLPSQEGDTGPTTNNFLRYNIISKGDTLYTIISNGDATSANQNVNQPFNFKYTLYSDSTSGERKLTENYSSTFSSGNPALWSVSEILNDQIIRADSNQIIPPITDGSFVFPNPFTYVNIFTGFQPTISISFAASSGTTVDFSIYSSGMIQVYSSEEIIGPLRNNSLGITWNGLDNDENKLASGVYIYVIKKGDDVIKGKVVIFNE